MKIGRGNNSGSGHAKPRGILAVQSSLVCLILLAFHFLDLTLNVMPAWAHHTGDSDILTLFEGNQGEHHVVLEVAPREPIAGSVAEFSLWMWRLGTGSPYTGRAHLSVQVGGASTTGGEDVPIPETGRGGVSVLYRGNHRFEHEGTYRLDLELPDLPGRWTASLQVRPAASAYSGILWFVVTVGLAAGTLLFLLALIFGEGARRTRRGLAWPGSRRT